MRRNGIVKSLDVPSPKALKKARTSAEKGQLFFERKTIPVRRNGEQTKYIQIGSQPHLVKKRQEDAEDCRGEKCLKRISAQPEQKIKYGKSTKEVNNGKKDFIQESFHSKSKKDRAQHQRPGVIHLSPWHPECF